MQATFDVHGTKIGVMTNSHVGNGIVEFSITQYEPMTVVGSGVIGEPGTKKLAQKTLPKGYAPGEQPQRHYLMLCLGKGEARAIASAIMGAADEL